VGDGGTNISAISIVSNILVRGRCIQLELKSVSPGFISVWSRRSEKRNGLFKERGVASIAIGFEKSRLIGPSRMISKSSDPAILFDLDGTLVDTAYRHVTSWAAALEDAGILVPEWKIHRRIGMSGRSLVRQLVREHGLHSSKIDVEQLEKAHDTVFNKLSSIQPLPGAENLLRYLTKHGVGWAIATTGGKQQTKKLLRTLRIPGKTVVVTGDDVAKAKPSPDVFVSAAKRLGIPVEYCIVVGDSVWDMLAAGRRRALSVGLLSGGYSQAELEQAGAFRVYADPADMLEHIEDIGLG
jgi:HAD superfamily hydrolase (TIGR01509 family)